MHFIAGFKGFIWDSWTQRPEEAVRVIGGDLREVEELECCQSIND